MPGPGGGWHARPLFGQPSALFLEASPHTKHACCLAALTGIQGGTESHALPTHNPPPLPPLICLQTGDSLSLVMMSTYLDSSMRISRDDNGQVFVMTKDVAMDD